MKCFVVVYFFVLFAVKAFRLRPVVHGTTQSGVSALETREKLAKGKEYVLTIVTAYLQIPSKHSVSQYHAWMKHVLTYQGPMVIFVDSKNYDFVQNHRKGLPTKVIKRELLELSTNKYRGNFNPELGCYWKDDHWHNKSLELYSMVETEKPNFMKQGTKYFDTPYYMWMDIGYVRGQEKFKFPSTWPSPERLYDLHDKFGVLVLHGKCKPYVHLPKYYSYSVPPQHLMTTGGLFVGTPKAIDHVHTLFYKKLDKITSEKKEWGGMDQFIMSHIVCENPSMFKQIQAEYASIVDGLNLVQKYAKWFYGIPYFNGWKPGDNKHKKKQKKENNETKKTPLLSDNHSKNLKNMLAKLHINIGQTSTGQPETSSARKNNAGQLVTPFDAMDQALTKTPAPDNFSGTFEDEFGVPDAGEFGNGNEFGGAGLIGAAVDFGIADEFGSENIPR